jgi:hypothetical protein
LEETGQAELHRGTGKLVDLVEACHIAHVICRAAAENNQENQAIIAEKER